MTLKLISKNLPNKYAEQLFRNELNYNADIDKVNNRIKLDFVRNTGYIDVSSQVFLNRVRQKRSQWKKDDVKYREYYKLICRNAYFKYMENNKTSTNPYNVNNNNRINSNNPKRYTYENKTVESLELIPENSKILLKQRSGSISIVNPPNNRANSAVSLPPIKPKNGDVNLSIPRFTNPYITNNKHNNFDEEKPFCHGKYSPCDKEFLEKLPEKVELTNTEIGRRFLQNRRDQNKMINRQKNNFTKLQANALNDNRFKNLVSSLDV